MRFVAVQEPTGSWTVFDTASEEPAELAGRVLIGLTLHEAHRLTAVVNDEAGCGETKGCGEHPAL
ncbi:hypothetical protein [Mesorhizobium sp. ORS 3428]|uniref:hypothetical protein n=1 Tax=Mesorhizobium sp. ORS 3428 TaxID=540997 RepID=UPI0010427B61|nr:hypothetical protein [Mesorhizobium sp. ORS 3428]